ncbi:transmembrane protein 71 [Hippocampus zosterae]|uniref:transmembrane protein 71 n=1 Tax=Hippocampus zosterae TaxID=109293 RepID=UPI00223D6FEB|nr:transmembrane protein 71 [Hippocampus zosterae]
MSFFSGALTSSPVKRHLRSSSAHQSLDVSLLSPDSSYLCYSSSTSPGSPSDGYVHSRCCRRSPRLLTNGYYAVTDDSFLWDEDGNVSLTPCAASVSYKENVFRVFRRRRRKMGSSLARLLNDVSESCQTWLDFGGVFRRGQDQALDLDPKRDHQKQDLIQNQDQDWAQEEGFTSLEEPSWCGLSRSQADNSCSFFTYDPSEVAPPPDKEAPPTKQMIQEEICSEICQSTEHCAQSLSGLSEVPPPSTFYANACRQTDVPQRTGVTPMTFFALVFVISGFMMLSSGCLVGGAGACVAAAAWVITATWLCAGRSTRLGGGWRCAKTEDITSRNE